MSKNGFLLKNFDNIALKTQINAKFKTSSEWIGDKFYIRIGYIIVMFGYYNSIFVAIIIQLVRYNMNIKIKLTHSNLISSSWKSQH